MARLVNEIGTGEMGIVIDKGARMQVMAVIRAIMVRFNVFVFFIKVVLRIDLFLYEFSIKRGDCQPSNKNMVDNKRRRK